MINCITGERPKGQIAVHALRMGGVLGTVAELLARLPGAPAVRRVADAW